MRQILFVSILIPLQICGCATHGVDQHYGEAWAQMQRAQTYNPRAGDDGAVIGTDPVQQMRALDAMRIDVADRSEVKPAPLINISQSSSTGGGGGGSQ
jgi:hypothetical protein